MVKCCECGKFCRPVEWMTVYLGSPPEPYDQIYMCAACVEKKGSFEPQFGIKPEFSCGRIELYATSVPSSSG